MIIRSDASRQRAAVLEKADRTTHTKRSGAPLPARRPTACHTTAPPTLKWGRVFDDREFNIPSRRQSKSTALRPRRHRVSRRSVGCTCREASGNSAAAGWGDARGSHASGTAKGDRGRCVVLPPLPFLQPARQPLPAGHAPATSGFRSPKPGWLRQTNSAPHRV